VFGATTVFAQLQASLNAILGVQASPSAALWTWLRRRLLSLGVVAAIGFVLIVSLVISALLALALPGQGAIWDTANQFVSVAILAFLFGLLFRYLPDARIPWWVAVGGGTATAMLFTLGKWAIGIYLARASVAGAYGAAGSLAILLLWVYYSAAIFLFGAELTRSYLDVCEVRVRPTAYGRLTVPDPGDSRHGALGSANGCHAGRAFRSGGPP
jgi:membrane protein